jgi:hypothetical protein
MKDSLRIEFDKLLSKNPKMNFDTEAKVSDILLFRDYLEKLKEAKNKLGITEFYTSMNSFHNLFLDISPIWKNEIPSYNDFRDILVDNKIDLFYLSETSLMGNLIYSYLCWEIFKEKEELINIMDGINPYNSVIIIIIINQHLIHRREGFFYINNLMVFKFRYNKLPSLTNEFLKFIDTICPVKNYGGTDVPNANEVAQLWSKFQELN